LAGNANFQGTSVHIFFFAVNHALAEIIALAESNSRRTLASPLPHEC
jgi:hypothetical protein